MSGSSQYLENPDPFTRILFVPPQLAAKPDTPSASAPPRGSTPLIGTSVSGRRSTSGRTPSRTPPPPPTRGVFDDPIPTASPGRAAHGHRVPTALPWRHAGPEVAPARMLSATRHQDYMDNWVTVYGFADDDWPIIIKELWMCGEIVDDGGFGTGSPFSNFRHVQFQTKEGAQRALQRNGELINGRLVLGVKAPSQSDRSAIERAMAESEPEEDENMDLAPVPECRQDYRPSQTVTTTTALRLTNPMNGRGGRMPASQALHENELPRGSKSWLTPVKNFLFGR